MLRRYTFATDARRATQQTLNSWRQESDESSENDESSSSTDGSSEDDTSANSPLPGDIADDDGAQTHELQQRNLFDYFINAATIKSATSIDGMSSDGLEACGDESSADSYSDMSIQPSAGLAQPPAGMIHHSAYGRVG